MALGVRCGDEVLARAAGSDARTALDALATLLAPKASAAQKAKEARAIPPRIEAAIASRGLAMGPCVPWTAPEIAVEERGAGVAQEAQALEAALAAVVAALEALQRDARGETHALLAAHIELARDPELRERASAQVNRGYGAGHAWRQATRATADLLMALDDERMRERAADLRDLERQVLRGSPASRRHHARVPARRDRAGRRPAALAADGARSARVGGICTARGGPTSHVAILAAAADIPAVVARATRSSASRTARWSSSTASTAGSRSSRRPPSAARSSARSRSAAPRARPTLAAVPSPAASRTGCASRCSPTSAAVRRGVAGGRAAAPKAAASCAPSSCSWTAPRPPAEDEQHAAYQAHRRRRWRAGR